jgi:hypothetical protein
VPFSIALIPFIVVSLPTENRDYTHFWGKEKDFAGAIPDLGVIRNILFFCVIYAIFSFYRY